MSTMFKAGDFFVRLRVQGDRPKLTVWNDRGKKIVSEFVSAGHRELLGQDRRIDLAGKWLPGFKLCWKASRPLLP